MSQEQQKTLIPFYVFFLKETSTITFPVRETHKRKNLHQFLSLFGPE